MCGRFTLRTPLRDVVEAFDLDTPNRELAQRWAARYNIAPTQDVAVVRRAPDGGGRQLSFLHWGLVPSWADDPAIGNRMINARSETAATKPAFREAFRRRRCLVVGDGFFEWKGHARPKQPYYIRLQEDRPLAFAGLWERWRQGELTIESCTILTTTANELLQELHDRMPVILDPADYEAWLDPAVDDPGRLERLLTPYPAAQMTTFPVSTVVNSARLDTPECIERTAPGKVQGTLFD
ncbi:MAG: SOS response-associated peptidase [Planctomycetota bacterium]|nr:MAG: SOS response-associated peptidase [Planctomycetota bacterium]